MTAPYTKCLNIAKDIEVIDIRSTCFNAQLTISAQMSISDKWPSTFACKTNISWSDTPLLWSATNAVCCSVQKYYGCHAENVDNSFCLFFSAAENESTVEKNNNRFDVKFLSKKIFDFLFLLLITIRKSKVLSLRRDFESMARTIDVNIQIERIMHWMQPTTTKNWWSTEWEWEREIKKTILYLTHQRV